MNRKQREKNRITAMRLAELAEALHATTVCARCGKLTYRPHYGGGVVDGEFVGGWTCKLALHSEVE